MEHPVQAGSGKYRYKKGNSMEHTGIFWQEERDMFPYLAFATTIFLLLFIFMTITLDYISILLATIFTASK